MFIKLWIIFWVVFRIIKNVSENWKSFSFFSVIFYFFILTNVKIEWIAGIRTNRIVVVSSDVLRGILLASGYQQPPSRSHKFVDYTEYQNADEHQHKSGNDFGKCVKTAFGMLLGSSSWYALLRCKTTCQCWESKALGKGQFVQRLGKGVRSNRTTCCCAKQCILKIQGVEHAISAIFKKAFFRIFIFFKLKKIYIFFI